MLSPKKSDNSISRSNMYLNYGLLGLASILEKQGWSPVVAHGNFEPPLEFITTHFSLGRLPSAAPLLLSIPSSFALSWAREFCSKVKLRWPEQRIIVGGRWVTADDANWMRMQIPHADLVVFGTAELTIKELMHPTRWAFTPGTEHSNSAATDSASPRLNYRLLDNFRDFTPSFEVSRGCGRKCNFCAEANAPLSDMKGVRELTEEMEDAAIVYGVEESRAYLESSFFRPSTFWIDELSSALATSRLRLQWRTETRVDTITARQIESLAKAGLKVLDLGLESASATQITSMGKSTNPAAYLRKASEVLQACSANGIWAKVNVLLYAGETESTLAETTAWLDAHRQQIKGVSVGPMIVFRFGTHSAKYIDELAIKDAKPISELDLDRQGYTHLHLSSHMPHERAIEESRKLSRSFMTERDYYDLKAFSYFKPSMTFTDFVESARTAAQDELNFRYTT